jgi:4-amino-4-deoxy-L-arabinose transferase-like glycosyltransferase
LAKILTEVIHYAFILLTLAVCFGFVCYGIYVSRRKTGTLDWIREYTDGVKRVKVKSPFRFTLHKLTRHDIAPLVILLAVFTFADFFLLGGSTAPQTFLKFTSGNDSAVVTLDNETAIGKIIYYSGDKNGGYELDYSDDGVNWTEVTGGAKPQTATHITTAIDVAMPQDHSRLFAWQTAVIDFAQFPDGVFKARYLRVRAISLPIRLGEIVVYDAYGQQVGISGAPLLCDEQDTAAENPTYMQSTYFDEIYHATSAFQALNGEAMYDTAHPPLAKVIMTLGIRAFGMTPFGWRAMGALFGVLQLLVMYLLLKNMFGKTPVAVCGTLLLGFDFMHFVQTRIATIDTYPVFFILLSFYFMYRFMCADENKTAKKMLPLALAGITFGVGAATKWIVVYAGAGLLAMFILKLVFDGHNTKLTGRYKSTGAFIARQVLPLVGIAFAFFIVIPAWTYYLAYIPFGIAAGMSVKGGMLWEPRYYKDTVWAAQKSMYSYHSALTATHPYQSQWYQWIVDGFPILFYRKEGVVSGTHGSIICMTNPAITWAGFLAIISMFWFWLKQKDLRALLIIIGFFSQLLPWMLVKRCVFSYHYFPSLIFLIIALSYFFDVALSSKDKGAKHWVYGFTIFCGALFCMFYPVLSGIQTPNDYINVFLKWLPSWAIG